MKTTQEWQQPLTTEFGATTLMREMLLSAPLREAVEQILLSNLYVRWHSQQSCDIVVTEKCGTPCMTSQQGLTFKLQLRSPPFDFGRRYLQQGTQFIEMCPLHD